MISGSAEQNCLNADRPRKLLPTRKRCDTAEIRVSSTDSYTLVPRFWLHERTETAKNWILRIWIMSAKAAEFEELSAAVK